MTQRPLSLLLFAIGCHWAVGDALILKDGRALEGRYLSATRRSVPFEVDGKPYT